MNERVAGLTDPRSVGRALTGPLGGLWRYRIENYLAVCDIPAEALRVGSRDRIYR